MLKVILRQGFPTRKILVNKQTVDTLFKNFAIEFNKLFCRPFIILFSARKEYLR